MAPRRARHITRIIAGISLIAAFSAAPFAAHAQSANELTDVQQKARTLAQSIANHKPDQKATNLKGSDPIAYEKAVLRKSFYEAMSREDLATMGQIIQNYETMMGDNPKNEDRAIVELYKSFINAYDPQNPNDKFVEKLSALESYLSHEHWSVAFQAYVLKCTTETHARNTFAALQSAQTALQLIPNELTIDARKARIQVTDLIVYLHNLQNNTALALENTDTLIRLQKEDGQTVNGTELLNNLMYSFGNWRDHDTRLFIAEILLKLEQDTPSTAPGLTELRIAQVQSEIGNFQAAQNFARQAIEKTDINTIKKSAQLQLAIALAGQGRVAPAKEALGALEIKSKGDQSHRLYADALLALAEGRNLDAIKTFNKRLDISVQRLLSLNNTDMTSLLASLENSRERQSERENALKREAELKAQKLAEQKKVNKLLWILVGLLVLSLIGALIFARIRHKISKALAVQTRLAKDADRMKTEFLGMISHELRTPLNGIIGIADFMHQHNKDQDVRHKSGIILNSGNILFKLVESIIDMSRIEAGKFELYTDDTPLMPLLQSTAQKWEEVAQQKNLTYTYFIDPELDVTASLDGGRVAQCINALLSNAIKFTERGRVHAHITSSAVKDGEIGLKVIIADTGLGISEDVQAKLFQPFLQADSSMTRKHNGSGLNLAITRSIAQMMGGDVTLISKNGRGSEFTLTFSAPLSAAAHSAKPVADPTSGAPHEPNDSIIDIMAPLHAPQPYIPPQAPIAEPASQLASTTDIRGMNVLILEAQAQSQALLKTFDINAVTAGSADEAIQFLDGRAVNTILIDLQMPELNAAHIIEHIRQNSSLNKNTPIIALSAENTAIINARCLTAGADLFLTKPVNPDELSKALGFARQGRGGAHKVA